MSYFSPAELQCRCGCKTMHLADGFLDKLIALREAVGHALSPTSVCRCPDNNTLNGGKPSSFHLTSHPWGCCAADISMIGWTSQKRWKFIAVAMSQGWSVGVNFAKQFIHIDRRSDYATGWPEPVFFPY